MPDVAEVGKETHNNVEKTSGCLSQGAKDAPCHKYSHKIVM